MSDPLQSIIYISLPAEIERTIGGFELDPEVLLPVETTGADERYDLSDLTWEQIIAGMLKVLAYQPDHDDAAYFRSFVLAVKPEIVDELSQTGVVQARNHDFGLAKEVFLALRSLQPQDQRHLINLALLAEDRAGATQNEDERQEYLEEAFELYKQLLSGDEVSADAHLNAGYFFLRRQNFERAREQLEAFREASADTERIAEVTKVINEIDAHDLQDKRFKEAFDFIRMGREEEGLARVRAFLQDAPNVWNGWFLLGWGLRRLQRYQEAIEAFGRALELGPRQVDTLNELAICKLELAHYHEAERLLTEALRDEPENTKVISNLGIVALKQEKSEEAAAYFRTVLEIDPNDKVAANLLQTLD